ncbi:MAG: biopolymer transporter ExbD [Verrucomicrobia bacterium]|nr:biopolymer transporter ExbD [Verrucomicrobiota bacterium]
MRRFSQRNSLVTLNDINITPLLDLAFVLLIIFIIATPMLEQSIDLKLPQGGTPVTQVESKDAQTIEVTSRGEYILNKRKMPLDQVITQVEAATRQNPNTFVAVRADQEGAYKHVAAVLDACQKRGITRFSLKTFPER